MAQACEATELIAIAGDGSSSRFAKEATTTGGPRAVSDRPDHGRLTLGQVAVVGGSDEVAVIPDLLQSLDLAEAIVTIGAAG